ncbi:rhamnulose-1-phosphate aldolase [Streptomyces sp. DSM 44915]|uniref:Rhamnulose-1-phosphate aldolase n=1 Tax=Streptomyces chisholmiae TaxID=3075540 RepID=A0ABU2JXQ5_9ACTN|nr:rhamnulose-1-phosphate aldolase [Streptomyces sp. DSM 44915]MDT0269632.1 rhamnulose-1-phosphate aldolase [Streptomyces sp. DSM 44915]
MNADPTTATVPSVLGPVVDVCADLYRWGWAENHAGNLSYRLTDAELAAFPVSDQARGATFESPFPELAGASFLVTAAGSPFRLLVKEPTRHTGVITISADGSAYTVVWGFDGDKRPTSELPAHLRGHQERAKVEPDNRVIMHCHPTNVVALTHVHPLDEAELTRSLWASNSETILAIPRGVGLLPWMVCGTDLIGIESAAKLREASIVIWACHGVLVAGRSVQDAMGVVESVEKAAKTYLLTRGGDRRSITDDQLRELAAAFGIEPPARFLP